jgi:hypothetical protein
MHTQGGRFSAWSRGKGKRKVKDVKIRVVCLMMRMVDKSIFCFDFGALCFTNGSIHMRKESKGTWGFDMLMRCLEGLWS